MTEEQKEFLIKAYQYSLDLERESIGDSLQGQLSPTDLALFSHITMFLRYEISQTLTGNPETAEKLYQLLSNNTDDKNFI